MCRTISMLILALSVMMLYGCTSKAKDRDPVKTNQYRDDGYLGMQQANPNLRTGQAHYTYAKDAKVMRDSVRKIPGVQGVAVRIYGSNATVVLDVPRSMSADEIVAVEERARTALARNMPRYDIMVKHRLR